MIFTIFIIILLVYLILALIIGRQLVYNDVFHKVSPNKSNLLEGYNYNKIEFPNHNKKTLRGWFIKSKNNPTNKTLFVLHGWTRTRLNYLDQIKFFVDSGFHVFAYDQIAHGDSDKGLITFGESEGLDLLDAVNYSREINEVNQEKIGVIGFSLGTGTAIYAIANSKNSVFKAAVLEGAFANSFDVGEKILIGKYGHFFGKLIGYAFFTFGTKIWSLGKFKHANTAEKISEITNTPIMIIRGKNDALVSDKSATLLLSSIKQPYDIWLHEKGHHVKSYNIYPEEYKKRVLYFLNKHI